MLGWSPYNHFLLPRSEKKYLGTENIITNKQSCPILTTCSGRESQDSTRTSRASKPGECDTFNENNMTFDLVKLHLIKEGPGARFSKVAVTYRAR